MHPLIAAYPIREYQSNRHFRLYFTGIKVRKYFGPEERLEPFSPVTPLRNTWPIPPAVNHEYVEFIPLFESIEACRGEKFTMIDLGAGCGRWSGHAAFIALSKGITAKLTMVEAEPIHYSFMTDFLRDNAISEDQCEIHQAAVVGDEKGMESSTFPLVVQQFVIPLDNPYDWHGQFVIRIRDKHKIRLLPYDYYGHQLFEVEKAFQFINVPTITLNRLLERHDKVDLVIMDIQGEEARVVQGARDMLTRCVGMVGIETHSQEIHNEIKGLFIELGWEIVVDGREKNEGDPTIFDQYLSFRNPFFHQS